MAYGVDDPMLLTAFETNLWHFSAGKNLIELQELNQLLRKAKSYKEFERAALQLTENFNRRWLRTEINAALLTAEATATYYRLLSRVDTFPYWEYKTQGDNRVRDEHKLLDGLILPATHPIWQKIFPPNAWGCRCYVVARMASEVAEVDFAEMEAKAEAFMNTEEYQRAKKQGWAVNRADLGEVFTRNQMYIKERFPEAHKQLNSLKPKDYGMSSYQQARQAANADAPVYEGTDQEYLDTLDVINQLRVISDYNKRHHELNKIPQKGLAYVQAMEQALKQPSEVWLNSSRAEGEPNRFVYIKYYQNKTVVVLGTVKDKLRKIQRWFTATDKTINKYRRGLLVRK